MNEKDKIKIKEKYGLITYEEYKRIEQIKDELEQCTTAENYITSAPQYEALMRQIQDLVPFDSYGSLLMHYSGSRNYFEFEVIQWFHDFNAADKDRDLFDRFYYKEGLYKMDPIFFQCCRLFEKNATSEILYWPNVYQKYMKEAPSQMRSFLKKVHPFGMTDNGYTFQYKPSVPSFHLVFSCAGNRLEDTERNRFIIGRFLPILAKVNSLVRIGRRTCISPAEFEVSRYKGIGRKSKEIVAQLPRKIAQGTVDSHYRRFVEKDQKNRYAFYMNEQYEYWGVSKEEK